MHAQREISPALAAKRLRPATPVTVYVEPHPVAQMSLRQLAEAVQAGKIPPLANVMLDQQEPWFPARDVIASCAELEPTRSARTAALAVAVSVLVWITHCALFGSAGFLPLALLTALAFATSLLVIKLPGLRTRNTRELLSKNVLGIAAAVILVAEGAAVASTIAYRGHEKRVDAALTAIDECSVNTLRSDDVEWLHDEDTWHSPAGMDESRTSDYDARLSRCKAKQERVKHEQACAKAAQAVTDHQALPPLAPDIQPNEVALLERIANHTLGGDDLKLPQLPCSETASAASVESAFRSAATTLGTEWLVAGIPGGLRSVVGRIGLAPSASDALRGKVEADADATLRTRPTLEGLSETVNACDNAKELTHSDGPNCSAARTRRETLLAKQAAAQKVQEARCDALKAAREQCTKQCEARLPKDDLGFSDFDKGLDCDDRCEKQIPLGDCG
ncbi:MAG TPA: hypothetical protein VK745_27720 [Polyangiaceae bacterium]|jgi:hypothetical protein|nr:hypothetical protein [Polyangiaceae bacterium]